MRSRAIMRLAAAFCALVLVAAACGDDDTSTNAGDPPVTTNPDTTDPTSTDPVPTSTVDHDHADHDDMDDMDDTDDMGGMEDMDDHAHEVVDVAADGAPSVDLEVFADPAGGVNIHVLTENFTVAPRSASTDHVDGEGHFHLFVDGEKVLRFYNDWIYYAGVTEGEVDIAVVLSANDHRSYAIDGEEIRAETTFTVPEHSHDDHSHGDAEAVEFVGDVPTIGLEVEPDPKSGWNAFITLDGMTLSPEHASGDHVEGEGHLHIYANGEKLGRLYGNATHLAALPEGEVEISVAAYTNDHRPYVVDGQPISAAATITVAS